MDETVADLFSLQNLVKRDPEGYKDEFLQQYKHFQAQYEIFKLKPSKTHKPFSNLIKFIANVAHCYPNHLSEFPTQISDLLEQSGSVLTPELRKVLIRSLILLRNRNLLSPTSLLSLFFKLFRLPDKVLRKLLRNHIVSDIAKCNTNKKNNELNRTLQNFMYTMLQDSSSVASRESISVMIELYRKNIWNDSKTVNVISQGVFSEDAKVIMYCIKFFLSPKGKAIDEEEKEIPTKKQVKKKYDKQGLTRMTKARKRLLKKKLQEVTRKNKQKLEEEADDTKQYNHAALLSIIDPQGYTEKVFRVLKQCTHSFEIKISIMNYISRLISTHQLIIHNFYSFMHKYTQPHQQHITQLLAILVQAVHSSVTPDIIHPLLVHVANTFVTDRRPNEVIAIGLNTIREISVRSPLVMDETLLKDLVKYRNSKDKGVMMATRSLIRAFRVIHPKLLPKKQRGRNTDIDAKPLEFAQEKVSKRVEGVELLEKYEKIKSGDWSFLEEEENEDTEWESVSDNEESGDDSESEQNNESVDSTITVESVDASKTENSAVTNEETSDAAEGDESNIDEEEEKSNENNENDENESKIEEPVDTSTPGLEATTILSDKDWAKIRYLQKNADRIDPKGKNEVKKRKLEELIRDVDESTLVGYQKRQRKSKDEIVKEIKEAKEDRKYVHGAKRLGGSRTNIEKRKNKPFPMLRQKALKKQRMSAKEKRQNKKKHLRMIQKMKLDHKM